jgi:hypothetical protein
MYSVSIWLRNERKLRKLQNKVYFISCDIQVTEQCISN